MGLEVTHVVGIFHLKYLPALEVAHRFSIDTAYSVKIDGLSVPPEGRNSTMYPSVADWAHSTRNSHGPRVRYICMGLGGEGSIIMHQND